MECALTGGGGAGEVAGAMVGGGVAASALWSISTIVHGKGES